MGENTISQVGDVFNNLGQWGLVGIVLAVIASMLLVVFAILGTVVFFMKGGLVDSIQALRAQAAEQNTRATSLQAVTDKQEDTLDRHEATLVNHEGRIVTLETKEGKAKK